MNERNTKILSEQGEERREAMLGELLNEMRAVHARRRTRQRAAAMAALGLLLAITVVLAMPKPAAPPMHVIVEAPAPAEAVIESAPAQRMIVDARIIQSDSSTLDRYIVRTSTAHRDSLINDDELLATLEAIGRPTGLVRMNGRAWLTASVADDEGGNGL